LSFTLKARLLGLPLCCALFACTQSAPTDRVAGASTDSTEARILAAASDGDNWLTHGRDYQETRNSPLTQIDTANVGKLGLAWFHDLDTARGQEATPLIVDGTMYTTSAWSKVQAFDAVSGKLLWQFDPQVPGVTGAKACCDVVNRGVAYWDGKVYVGTLDGRLIAIDAKSGKPVWSTLTVDQSKSYTITGAPRVIKGRVIIGNGGAEFGVRGYVSAYDAETGKKLWRFYTVPGQPGKADGEASDTILQTASATWDGDWWSNGGGGGGTVWDSMAYDPEQDLLYIGVGNGSYWRKSLRSPGAGDNLFIASIVALKPETGEYVWHYQQTPGDQWDYTSTQHIILADIPIDGTVRKVLMQAPKNGFFFVIDRTNGKLISAKPYTTVNWATGYDAKTGRPAINPEADYSRSGKTWGAMPGALGGHDWQPMAYNPGTGLVYIPEQQLGFAYQADPGFVRKPVGFNLGLDLRALDGPTDAKAKAALRASVKGSIVAWDPRTQRKVWSVPHAGPWNGGILSTSGGLIFQGDADGMLNAYDAKTGKKLWSYDCQSGILAPPVTWARDGKQYVTVVVGWGGAYPLFAGELAWGKNGPIPNRSRVITFALDGTGQLPAPPAETQRTLQSGVAQFANATTIEQGRQLYFRTCVVCHGTGAVSGGVTPDLRYSPAIADARTWSSIVADGGLADQGMAGFKDNFSPEEIEAIRAYVVDRARAGAKGG